MTHPHSPILVIDSGLGGLTSVRALRKHAPDEPIIYFGDTARSAYGCKSATTVSAYICQIIEYLRPLQPKHVLLACHTASATALPAARAAFPDLSITGVVEPSAKAAIVAAGSRKVPVIGVLATETTVRSGVYERAIIRKRQHARIILRAAPLLAPLAEEARHGEDPLVRLAIEQYLKGMIENKLDVLVLGGSPYSLLRPTIEAITGPKVKIIDSADVSAQDVARRLAESGRLRPGAVLSVTDSVPTPAGSPGMQRSACRPMLQCYVTDDPNRFARLAPRFLGAQIPAPIWVGVDELYQPREPQLLRRPA